MNLIDEINALDLLFLRELSETESGLKITFCGSITVENEPDISNNDTEALFSLLKNASQVIPDETHSYEIFFPQYISYQTRCESYVELHEGETYSGNPFAHFRVYDKSFYGEYIDRCTLAKELGAEYKQYQLCLANQVIDVMAIDEPVITRK